MSLSKQLVRFLHSRFFQVAVPAMGISRRLKKSRRSGRFSNVHLFLLTVASAMKCQVQTVENGQYSYLVSIFKIFFPSAIPFWNFLPSSACRQVLCGRLQHLWRCQVIELWGSIQLVLPGLPEPGQEGWISYKWERADAWRSWTVLWVQTISDKIDKKLTKWNPSLNGRHFQLSSFSLRECNPKLTDFSPRLPPSHSRGDTTHPPAHHTNQDFTSK